jgi:hypothetical protein
MELEALLDELRGNVLRDDSELATGTVDDSLWTDETLVRYINDAQSRFARKSFSLRDATTPEITQVTLATGVSSYVLHTSVLAVVSGRYNTDTVDLPRVGRVVIQSAQPDDPPYFDPNIPAAMTPGRPQAFGTDETIDVDAPGSVTLTVYPAPTATEDGTTLYLRVARLPLDPFDIDKTEAECELPEGYQLDMLEWAAYRALRNSDIDGHSSTADKHEKRFNDAVTEVLRAVRQKMRAPITFEFGRAGFTWDR